MAEIRLERIAHAYGAQPTQPSDYALKRLDHCWDDGGAYALLGPSGCGKSTLLNVMSGLLRPSEGHVWLDGENVTDRPTEARNIAQVFQFPVTYDTMSVFDNLAFPLRNRGHAEAAVRQRVLEVSDALDLGSVLDIKAKALTADLKQMISLGRGLVRQDVAAILFDEPLTMIDPQLKWTLRMQLKALHQQFDHTMVYVTHDQTEALSFADKVAVMFDGSILQVGTPQELFEKPAHTFVGYFIGSPGMNVLPLTVVGGSAEVAGHAIELPLSLGHHEGGTLELGVRPEFTRLVRDDEAHQDSLPVVIERIEDAGKHRVVRALFRDHPINVVVPDGAPISDRANRVRFDRRHVNVYADGWAIPAAGRA